jgi:hypothetical protein
MKSLKFTKAQYEKLIMLVSLGERMLNQLIIPEDESKDRELSEYIYTNAEKFGLADWVEQYDDPSMGHMLSLDPEVECVGVIEDYNEMIFREYLIDNMAWRDAYAYFMDHLMSPGEYKGTLLVDKHWELIDEYNDLFDRQGLESLQFVEKLDPQLN